MGALQYKKCLVHGAITNIYELFKAHDVLGSVFLPQIFYASSVVKKNSGFFDFGAWQI
jgi:hypothetical protein